MTHAGSVVPPTRGMDVQQRAHPRWPGWWRDLGRKSGDQHSFHVPGVRRLMGSFATAGGPQRLFTREDTKSRRKGLTFGKNECILKTNKDQHCIGKYNNMPEKQRFMTIVEAAEFLHVSETSLRRWTNSGKLRCFRVGGRGERRFLVEDLLTFVASGKGQQESPATESGNGADTTSLERHICLFFVNQDEQWQMMRPYLLEHLGAGVPVLYIQDSTPPERLLELLRVEGLPVDELIARELLRVISAEQAYLLTGRFDAQRMLAFMESAILAALAAGYDRVFLTGEMTWSLPNAPGAEGMMHYEALLNPLVDKYPGSTIVCQYDLRRFDGPSVLDALLTHPSVHVPGGRAAGFYGL